MLKAAQELCNFYQKPSTDPCWILVGFSQEGSQEIPRDRYGIVARISEGTWMNPDAQHPLQDSYGILKDSKGSQPQGLPPLHEPLAILTDPYRSLQILRDI